MRNLLDRTFWNFVSGFVLILVVSFSLLTFLGTYDEATKNVTALVEAVSEMVPSH